MTDEQTATAANGEATSAPLPQGEVVLLDPPRLPWDDSIGRQYADLKVTRDSWRALIDAVYPSAKSTSSILLALAYCQSRGLDPFKRVIHIVPIWSPVLRRMVDTVWPGIAELRTTATRTKKYAGNDACTFGPTLESEFVGSDDRGREIKITVAYPEWAQMTVYKMVANERVAFVGPRVRWLETYGSWKGSQLPNAMWRQRPWGQLEKCAEAAALRRAFPEESSDYIVDEVQGRAIDETGALIKELPEHREPAVNALAMPEARAERKHGYSDEEQRRLGERAITDTALNRNGVKALNAAGYQTLLDTAKRTTEQLMEVRGFGQTLLTQLRKIEKSIARPVAPPSPELPLREALEKSVEATQPEGGEAAEVRQPRQQETTPATTAAPAEPEPERPEEPGPFEERLPTIPERFAIATSRAESAPELLDARKAYRDIWQELAMGTEEDKAQAREMIRLFEARAVELFDKAAANARSIKQLTDAGLAYRPITAELKVGDDAAKAAFQTMLTRYYSRAKELQEGADAPQSPQEAQAEPEAPQQPAEADGQPEAAQEAPEATEAAEARPPWPQDLEERLVAVASDEVRQMATEVWATDSLAAQEAAVEGLQPRYDALKTSAERILYSKLVQLAFERWGS